MAKKNFLGLPWWLVLLGGGAVVYYLMKKSPAVSSAVTSATDAIVAKVAKAKAQYMTDYPTNKITSVTYDDTTVRVFGVTADGQTKMSTEIKLADL